jgi:hypothetical protein
MVQGKCRGCDAATVNVYQSELGGATGRMLGEADATLVTSLLDDMDRLLQQLDPMTYEAMINRRLATCYCDTSAASQRRFYTEVTSSR